MSWKYYSNIDVLIEDEPMQEILIEINNMLYRELVFPVFKTNQHWRFIKHRVLVFIFA